MFSLWKVNKPYFHRLGQSDVRHNESEVANGLGVGQVQCTQQGHKEQL
jgi:hypothetical protein